MWHCISIHNNYKCNYNKTTATLVMMVINKANNNYDYTITITTGSDHKNDNLGKL